MASSPVIEVKGGNISLLEGHSWPLFLTDEYLMTKRALITGITGRDILPQSFSLRKGMRCMGSSVGVLFNTQRIDHIYEDRMQRILSCIYIMET